MRRRGSGTEPATWAAENGSNRDSSEADQVAEGHEHLNLNLCPRIRVRYRWACPTTG
jgi:hypothetical protein